MPKKVVPLNDKQIKQAKAKEKQYKLSDGDGLQLRVKPNGTKTWLFDYYHPFTKKRLSMSFGSYPEVSLVQARKLRVEAREQLTNNIDPKSYRDEVKAVEESRHVNTLEFVSRQWMETKIDSISPRTVERNIRPLEMYVFPELGNYPIHQITAIKTIEVLRRLEAKGNHESVKRVCQILNRIMRFAVNLGLLEHNKLEGIGDAFKPPSVKNMPTIKPEELPELMEAVLASNMNLITRSCLEWQLHTMMRPGEAAKTPWREIDFENKVWVIPSERMKMNREHKVPLSDYVMELLEKLKMVSGHREYLFPSRNDPRKHVSPEIVNNALKRIGFGGRIVAHGFRSLASTTLNEQGFDGDLIEACLAHADKNEIRSIYNRTDYLERRRPIMQWWSEHIQLSCCGK